MNGFDGAMTMLGITPGACIAMGVSWFSDAYIAEKQRHLKELEKKTNNKC